MAIPKQKPGKSKQDYGTPKNFIGAVEKYFGPITFDLAADANNCIVPKHFSVNDDSLKQDWFDKGPVIWLNPPFEDIASWVKKAYEESLKLPEGHVILMLVPASIGANWFYDHVHRKACVFALKGRLTFNGQTAPFPKDCMLLMYYNPDMNYRGFDVWDWKKFLTS
jgi:phage N-6-adenine-methyltransferase